MKRWEKELKEADFSKVELFEMSMGLGIRLNIIFVSAESKSSLPESRNAVYKCSLWESHVTRVVLSFAVKLLIMSVPSNKR